MQSLEPINRNPPPSIPWSTRQIALVTAIVIGILVSFALIFHFKEIGGIALPTVMGASAFITLVIGLVLIMKKRQIEGQPQVNIQKIPSNEWVEKPPACEPKPVAPVSPPEAITPEPEEAPVAPQKIPLPDPPSASLAPPVFLNKKSLNLVGLSTEERLDFIRMILNNTPHLFKRSKDFHQELSNFSHLDILEKLIEPLDNESLLKLENYIEAGLEENPDAIVLLMQKKNMFYKKISKNISLVKDLDKRQKIKDKIRSLGGYDSHPVKPLEPPKTSVQPTVAPPSFSLFDLAKAAIQARNNPRAFVPKVF